MNITLRLSPCPGSVDNIGWSQVWTLDATAQRQQPVAPSLCFELNDDNANFDVFGSSSEALEVDFNKDLFSGTLNNTVNSKTKHCAVDKLENY